MMRKMFLCVLISCFCSASDYALTFIHIGDSVPSFLYTTLKQARYMNRECPIYFLVNDTIFQHLEQSHGDFLKNEEISLVNVSHIPLTLEHQEYRKVAKFTPSFREGFWNHATERFFYLYDFQLQSGVENLIQIETDVMLYADVTELMSGFKELNVNIAATFQWKTCCVPSFVFFKDQSASQGLASHIVEELRGATGNYDVDFNDMVTLASFREKRGEEAMTPLPIVMSDYAKFYPPNAVPYAHGGTTLEFLSKNGSFFKGYLFDAAALGIYVKGYDRKNGNYSGGAIHPKSFFNPSKFKYFWGKDSQGRIVPYLQFKGTDYRIINLHFHSKLPEEYTSYGESRAELVSIPPVSLGIARDWHERIYLPSLKGKVLYVGVGQYTQRYYRLTQNPKLFETIDFLPERARYGSPYRHYVADFVTFDPGYLYDHLSLFGIMGHPKSVYYSIIDDLTITEAIEKADQLLKVGGTLELGPNHISAPGQTKEFWLERFTLPPLDKYTTLFLGVGEDNIVWWGQKNL